jgi:ABC-type Fe3+ transport system permease subunit
MATFDWIPILEGKYMTYYQIGALILSAVCLLFAFLNFLMYLILSKFQFAQQQHSPQSRQKKLNKWKKIVLANIFIWLSFVPLVCSSLDVLYLVEGIIGMFAILLIGIYLLNGITSSQE